jgi:hypothetical protein
MNPLRRGLLGGYCLVFLLLTLYLVISLLAAPPREGAQGEVLVSLFGQALLLGAEARLLLLVALAGALGASIHAASSFAVFAGLGRLATSWLWWYVLRPFIGAALATVLYFLVRGVLLSAASDPRAVSPYGLLAFAGLSGMFSKQAIEWMGKVFDQMFRRLSNVENSDTKGP